MQGSKNNETTANKNEQTTPFHPERLGNECCVSIASSDSLQEYTTPVGRSARLSRALLSTPSCFHEQRACVAALLSNKPGSCAHASTTVFSAALGDGHHKA